MVFMPYRFAYEVSLTDRKPTWHHRLRYEEVFPACRKQKRERYAPLPMCNKLHRPCVSIVPFDRYESCVTLAIPPFLHCFLTNDLSFITASYRDLIPLLGDILTAASFLTMT